MRIRVSSWTRSDGALFVYCAKRDRAIALDVAESLARALYPDVKRWTAVKESHRTVVSAVREGT